ncbi:hypothetical protein [Fodinicurvata fenggangensis]|nr:hypothetical protein [Fodinicurvata fenggangensis]
MLAPLFLCDAALPYAVQRAAALSLPPRLAANPETSHSAPPPTLPMIRR